MVADGSAFVGSLSNSSILTVRVSYSVASGFGDYEGSCR